MPKIPMAQRFGTSRPVEPSFNTGLRGAVGMNGLRWQEVRAISGFRNWERHTVLAGNFDMVETGAPVATR